MPNHRGIIETLAVIAIAQFLGMFWHVGCVVGLAVLGGVALGCAVSRRWLSVILSTVVFALSIIGMLVVFAAMVVGLMMPLTAVMEQAGGKH